MRIVSIIGVPCVGKGTLIAAVQEKMLDHHRVAIVSTSLLVKQILTEDDKKAMAGGGLFPRETELRELMYSTIEDLSAFGSEVVLVDGFPRFDDQLRWMQQNLYDHDHQIIQVLAPSDFEIVRRAGIRNRDEHDQPRAVMARIDKQRELIGPLERLIFQYGVPYTSVVNDYLERATLELISRIQWPQPPKKEKKGKR